MPKRGHHMFTSESVSMGHPDKVSDQISDAVLDLLIGFDPQARVACETMCTTGLVVIGGEITVHTPKAVAALNDVEDVARKTLADIGYAGDIGMRFDAEGCGVVRTFHGQSADISRGVSKKEPGAGDQGLMFGFACRETPSLMPLPIDLSHRLVEQHAKIRRSNKIKGLRPDAKSQVTVEYNDKGKPARIDTVVLSTQHTADWNGAKKQAQLKQQVIKHIINPIMPKRLYDASKVKIHVNPTGQFEVGGPHGDVGLTGRKIIVDTYGGRGRHGGGAFSGKDPSKVDRSAAYMARYVAKNVVAAGLADQCEVQLSYAIGVAQPTSVNIDCFGTAKVDEHDLAKAVTDIFPLTPRGILQHLKLRNPIFGVTAAHGHFGRKPGSVTVNGKKYDTFTWEKTDLANKLARALR
ncbi:methionine adenosyltransferase [Mucisphaera sp.]|uniref:methionine adenosyltransferase n=1 Tax=Mucisphaera sp. TaxID=2913024 RepID=UPI003D0AD102